MADAVEVGSTNVYADLGYLDPEAFQRKASFAAEIARTIKVRHLPQEAVAKLLGGIQQTSLGLFVDSSAARAKQRCLSGLRSSATK